MSSETETQIPFNSNSADLGYLQAHDLIEREGVLSPHNYIDERKTADALFLHRFLNTNTFTNTSEGWYDFWKLQEVEPNRNLNDRRALSVVEKSIAEAYNFETITQEEMLARPNAETKRTALDAMREAKDALSKARGERRIRGVVKPPEEWRDDSKDQEKLQAYLEARNAYIKLFVPEAEQTVNTTKLSKTISRRQFLILGGLATAAVALSACGVPTTNGDGTPGEPTPASIPETGSGEDVRKLDETGLKEVNPDLYQFLIENRSYIPNVLSVIKNANRIGIEMPYILTSYKPNSAPESFSQEEVKDETDGINGNIGQRTIGMLELILDTRLRGILHSVGISDNYSTCFDAIEHAQKWPRVFSGGLTAEDFIHTTLHETIGHGTYTYARNDKHEDTIQYFYPNEIFFPLLAEQWRILAEIPQMKTYQEMYYYQGTIYEIGRIATSSHESQFQIITKRRRLDIGKELLEKLNDSKSIGLDLDIEQLWMAPLSESHARAMEFILYTDSEANGFDSELRGSTIIKKSVQKILQIITGDTSLTIDDVNRRLKEFKKVTPDIPAPELNTEPAPEIPAPEGETEDVNKGFSQYQTFLSEQTIPSEFSNPALQEYLSIYAKFLPKYPLVGEEHIDPRESIRVFDPPQMNYWETEELENYMRRSRLTNIFLAQGVLSDEDKVYLEEGVRLMQQYKDRIITDSFDNPPSNPAE